MSRSSTADGSSSSSVGGRTFQHALESLFSETERHLQMEGSATGTDRKHHRGSGSASRAIVAVPRVAHHDVAPSTTGGLFLDYPLDDPSEMTQGNDLSLLMDEPHPAPKYAFGPSNSASGSARRRAQSSGRPSSAAEYDSYSSARPVPMSSAPPPHMSTHAYPSHTELDLLQRVEHLRGSLDGVRHASDLASRSVDRKVRSQLSSLITRLNAQFLELESRLNTGYANSHNISLSHTMEFRRKIKKDLREFKQDMENWCKQETQRLADIERKVAEREQQATAAGFAAQLQQHAYPALLPGGAGGVTSPVAALPLQLQLQQQLLSDRAEITALKRSLEQVLAADAMQKKAFRDELQELRQEQQRAAAAVVAAAIIQQQQQQQAVAPPPPSNKESSGPSRSEFQHLQSLVQRLELSLSSTTSELEHVSLQADALRSQAQEDARASTEQIADLRAQVASLKVVKPVAPQSPAHANTANSSPLARRSSGGGPGVSDEAAQHHYQQQAGLLPRVGALESLLEQQAESIAALTADLNVLDERTTATDHELEQVGTQIATHHAQLSKGAEHMSSLRDETVRVKDAQLVRVEEQMRFSDELGELTETQTAHAADLAQQTEELARQRQQIEALQAKAEQAQQAIRTQAEEGDAHAETLEHLASSGTKTVQQETAGPSSSFSASSSTPQTPRDEQLLEIKSLLSALGEDLSKLDIEVSVLTEKVGALEETANDRLGLLEDDATQTRAEVDNLHARHETSYADCAGQINAQQQSLTELLSTLRDSAESQASFRTATDEQVAAFKEMVHEELVSMVETSSVVEKRLAALAEDQSHDAQLAEAREEALEQLRGETKAVQLLVNQLATKHSDLVMLVAQQENAVLNSPRSSTPALDAAAAERSAQAVSDLESKLEHVDSRLQEVADVFQNYEAYTSGELHKHDGWLLQHEALLQGRRAEESLMMLQSEDPLDQVSMEFPSRSITAGGAGQAPNRLAVTIPQTRPGSAQSTISTTSFHPGASSFANLPGASRATSTLVSPSGASSSLNYDPRLEASFEGSVDEAAFREEEESAASSPSRGEAEKESQRRKDMETLLKLSAVVTTPPVALRSVRSDEDYDQEAFEAASPSPVSDAADLAAQSAELSSQSSQSPPLKQQPTSSENITPKAAAAPAVPAPAEAPLKFTPSVTDRCNTADDFRRLRSEMRAYGVHRLVQDQIAAGWFVRDENGAVELATEAKPFNPFARLVAGKLPAPYGNLLASQGMASEATEFMVALNRPELDAAYASSEPDMIGRASMSRRHQFLLVRSLEWSTFNVATFGMSDREDEPIESAKGRLEAAIHSLNDMEACAVNFTRRDGWSQDRGLFFHAFPFNSVQALHLHMVDMEHAGPTFHHLNYKNLPLAAARQVLLEELDQLKHDSAPAKFTPSKTDRCNTASDFRHLRSEMRTYGIRRIVEDQIAAGWFVRGEDGAVELASEGKPFNPFARLVAGKLPAPYGDLLAAQGMASEAAEFMVALNRPELDAAYASSEPDMLGRASMSRRHQFLLVRSLEWSTFNVATFGMSDREDESADAAKERLVAAIHLLNDMEACALDFTRRHDWSKDCGLFFHAFPFNSVHALHLHMVDMEHTGPTFDHLNYKNLPLAVARHVLLEELQQLKFDTAPAGAPLKFTAVVQNRCRTVRDFRLLRQEVRTYGVHRLVEDQIAAGWFVRDADGAVEIATEAKPFNPFARLVSGKLQAPYGNLLASQDMASEAAEFMVALNRPELDDAYASSDPEWLGRASMSRRHQFLLVRSLEWSTFNVATFALSEREDGSIEAAKERLITAIHLLNDMEACALEYTRRDGWSKERGLFFHAFPFNSVQALHLHMVDMEHVGPTFHHLNYKNMPLADARQVLLEELDRISPETASAFREEAEEMRREQEEDDQDQDHEPPHEDEEIEEEDMPEAEIEDEDEDVQIVSTYAEPAAKPTQESLRAQLLAELEGRPLSLSLSCSELPFANSTILVSECVRSNTGTDEWVRLGWTEALKRTRAPQFETDITCSLLPGSQVSGGQELRFDLYELSPSAPARLMASVHATLDSIALETGSGEQSFPWGGFVTMPPLGQTPTLTVRPTLKSSSSSSSVNKGLTTPKYAPSAVNSPQARGPSASISPSAAATTSSLSAEFVLPSSALTTSPSASARSAQPRVLLLVRLQNLPLSDEGRNRPLVALFVQDSDVAAVARSSTQPPTRFSFVCQSEWLENVADAEFQNPLVFTFTPGHIIKLNVYDTDQADISDSHRMGSVFIRQDDLFEAAMESAQAATSDAEEEEVRELTFSLNHEDSTKNELLGGIELIIEAQMHLHDEDEEEEQEHTDPTTSPPLVALESPDFGVARAQALPSSQVASPTAAAASVAGPTGTPFAAARVSRSVEEDDEEEHDDREISIEADNSFAREEEDEVVGITPRSHERLVAQVHDGLREQQEQRSALSSPSNATAVPSPLSHSIRISIACKGLPVTKASGTCDPIAAVFSEHLPTHVFEYISQTEWLHDVVDPEFTDLIELRHTPFQNQLVKFSVYDVSSESVSDDERVGSVLVRLDDLVASTLADATEPLGGAATEVALLSGVGSEVVFELLHDSDSKHRALAGATICIRYEWTSLSGEMMEQADDDLESSPPTTHRGYSSFTEDDTEGTETDGYATARSYHDQDANMSIGSSGGLTRASAHQGLHRQQHAQNLERGRDSSLHSTSPSAAAASATTDVSPRKSIDAMLSDIANERFDSDEEDDAGEYAYVPPKPLSSALYSTSASFEEDF